jgi:hypothetical protein
MITGIHILLTYRCTNECDHCFVFGSPQAEGTFTLAQVRTLIEEAEKIGSVKMIFFEGGEAFLFYPLLLEGVRLAREAGFQAGIVTNAYFAATVEDALLWLRPLADLGLAALSISDDALHGDGASGPPKHALEAARQLKIGAGTISIEGPSVKVPAERKKGEPIVGGGVMFKGRAAEKLTAGLPTIYWREFTECPHEDLANPSRVHVDAFGWVHLCQGLCMGNAWETPLSDLIRGYDVKRHPVAAPLSAGGPARLAADLAAEPEGGFVDACHLCYATRKRLLDRFPECLAPRRLYGETLSD